MTAPVAPQGSDSQRSRTTVAESLLTASGVRRLDGGYLDAYRSALASRETEPLAVHLHLSKLPELPSLSIAAQCSRRLLGYALEPAPFPDDLHDRIGRRVAVKGTGPSAWIAITDTDRASMPSSGSTMPNAWEEAGP